ncbi:MAG: response regulator [Selenomonadaceae bacterium]|nr:response regulator [Selenomonadaceae bacterium]
MERFIKNLRDSALNTRSILEFIGIIVVVMVLTLFSYFQVSAMLNTALEDSVEKTVQTIAYELKKQFDLEIESLETRAGYVEKHKVHPNELVMSLDDIEGENVGIISTSGELLAGRKPPDEIINVTWLVYDGRSVIRYLRGVGLVFAVQMQVDGKEYVLFDYYNDEAVRKKFRTISFNGDGTVILLNDLENWTVLANGISPIKDFKEVGDGFIKLGEKIGYSGESTRLDSGAIYYEYNGGKYFIYSAVVSKEHHFAISGYVPWESVAVGFSSIYIILLIAFGLFISLLAMVVRAVFKARERRRLEKEKSLALEASQIKSEFLSNMSHEIRTPINAILGMDEMILRETKEPNTLEYAENLRHAGVSLLGIINDILDFSKIEAGKMEIIPVEYHLSSILNDVVNMIKPRAEKKNLKLIVEADENLPSVLFGDEIRIKQIITNILTNAVKYTENGSVTLKIGFENSAENVILLKVSIIDTGIGIKKEDIAKLFNAFERIEEKRNRTIEGTGLGMNITQQLLHLMNSQLEVSSVYGKGSTFSFEILQNVINAEPLGDFNVAFKNSFLQRKKYQEKFIAPDAKILVVDDTVMNLTVIKGLLKQTKIQIDTAASGFECLKLVQEKKYNLIFLDHRMPGMDGIETLAEIKKLPTKKNSDTPIISLTANAISGSREKYIAAGFQDYLTKPINSSALESLLIKYLPPELVKISDDESTEEISESEKNLPEFLLNVEGLDTTAGIQNCDGAEFYIEVLKVFVQSIKSGSEEIQNYFDVGDWKNYTTKVHALKSTAKIIGATELSERAKRLEDAGNSGYIDEIREGTPALLQLYQSYLEKLSPFMENVEDSNSNSNKPLISDEELAEAYETIKEISASFDYDSLQFVLNSLEDYRLPENETEKFKALKESAAKLDWEKITELIGKN